MMVLFGSSQKKVGIQNPVFRKETMPDIEKDLECWGNPTVFCTFAHEISAWLVCNKAITHVQLVNCK